MKFTPKTKQELQFERLIPEGEYTFRVVKAAEEVSKYTNTPFINLQLRIANLQGKEFTIFDKLEESKLEKLMQFCETTGLLDCYESGDLDASKCINAMGSLKVVVFPSKDEKPPKNWVKSYGEEKETPKVQTTTKSSATEIVDDAIEF